MIDKIDWEGAPPCLVAMNERYKADGVPESVRGHYMTSLLRYFYRRFGADVEPWGDNAKKVLVAMCGAEFYEEGMITKMVSKASNNKITAKKCLGIPSFCDTKACGYGVKQEDSEEAVIDVTEHLPKILSIRHIEMISMSKQSYHEILFAVPDGIEIHEDEDYGDGKRCKRVAFDSKAMSDVKHFDMVMMDAGFPCFDYPIKQASWKPFINMLTSTAKRQTEADVTGSDPYDNFIGCFRIYLEKHLNNFDGGLQKAIDLIPSTPLMLMQSDDKDDYWVAFSIDSFYNYAMSAKRAIYAHNHQKFINALVAECGRRKCEIKEAKEVVVSAGKGRDARLEDYHVMKGVSLDNLFNNTNHFIADLQAQRQEDEESKQKRESGGSGDSTDQGTLGVSDEDLDAMADDFNR